MKKRLILFAIILISVPIANAKDGDWIDMSYGEHQQHKIKYRCTSQSYYWWGPKKGEPKFDVGTYYPLLGCVYTQEMCDADA